MNKLTIAIDGPAGAGKTTVAKIVAKKFNILYLDTGAMYRAVALKVLKTNVEPKNPNEVISILSSTDIDVKYEGGQQVVYLDGRDVTPLIRTPEVSRAASDVATIPEVRLKLVEIQRRLAGERSLVMDGRDIGTFVLPDARFKFFLTASLEERARRRWKQMKEKGFEESLENVIEEIKKRDENDTRRAFAPLRKADDAILIDTTDKSIDEVVNEICGYIKKGYER